MNVLDLATEELKFTEINASIESLQYVITEALDSTRQIDKLSELISSNNNPTSISIEAINLTISTIYENLGATRYAFSTESISNEIALENINEFVQKLWVKIKETLDDLWNKVSDFWNDNFASLTKIKRSLESVLLRVRYEYEINNPKVVGKENQPLKNLFGSDENIDDKSIEKIINTHRINFNILDSIINHTKHFNKHIKTISNSEFEHGVDYLFQSLCKEFIRHPFRFGEERHPIVNGEYLTLEYNYDEESHDINLTTDKQKVEIAENIEILAISKHRLEYIIKQTLDIISSTFKYKSIQEGIKKEFDDLTRVYDKMIESGEPDLNGEHKKVIRLVYRINSSIPGVFGVVILSNVKLARGVVNYAEFCMRA